LKEYSTFAGTAPVIFKANKGLKLPLSLKLDIIKKTKLISHREWKRVFQINIPSIGINEVGLWVSTGKNVRNAAGEDWMLNWMKPMTNPAAMLKIFVRIAVASISRI
jgi:hypothetical protein